MKKNHILLTTCALILALGLCSTEPAEATPNGAKSLVGSWKLEDAATGNLAVETFTSDGTQVLSVPGSPAAHGAWEHLTERTFAAKTVAISGGNGSPVLITTVAEVLEVARDAQSYVSEYETTVTLLDGTVVASLTGTVNATRITVD